jgi:hypothetical protein
VLATTAFAGTISATNAGLVSEELLSFQDVNITNASNDATYVPTSTVYTKIKNPIFEFTFANMKNMTATANVDVVEYLDGNTSNIDPGNVRTVATNAALSGADSNIVTFTAVSGDIYIYNSRAYVIEPATADDLKGQIAEGSTSAVTLAVDVKSGDSLTQWDEAGPTTLYTIGKEFTATVSGPLNARIDASSGFETFFDQHDLADNASDTLTIAVKRNVTVVGGGLDTPMLNLVTFSDTNLTANNYSTAAAYDAATPATTDNDFNVTVAATAAATADDVNTVAYTLDYTVDGTSKIEKTNFGAHMWVAEAADHTFDMLTNNGTNAGAWTIYGYNAQIPNVSANDIVETTFAFTNRSGLAAPVIFTLIDPDGTAVTLSSDDYASISGIGQNETKKYKASALKALAASADAAFDGAAAYFAVEVSIPTTPSSVYGYASFKNNALGQFKDLPVYNTSDMTY